MSARLLEVLSGYSPATNLARLRLVATTLTAVVATATAVGYLLRGARARAPLLGGFTGFTGGLTAVPALAGLLLRTPVVSTAPTSAADTPPQPAPPAGAASPREPSAPPREPSDGGSARPKAGTYLDENEPGGIDDADVWVMATVAMIPIAAVVAVIIVYAAAGSEQRFVALGVGCLVAIAMFAGLYVLYLATHFNTAQHASVDTYNSLCQRMHHVTTVLPPPWSGDESLEVAACAARASATEYGRAFNYARKKTGIHWVMGKGYLDLYRIVHRAEEALIVYEPVDMVIADGLRDQSRIAGSTIPHRDDLLNQLRRALVELSPAASGYFAQAQAPALPTPVDASAAPQPASESTPALPAPALPTTPAKLPTTLPAVSLQTQARIILRDIRTAINDFRDARRARLIEARNDLVARIFLTGLATSLLLVFVVLGRPPEEVLLTGAVLYAVGAIVGLFSRLYADLSSDAFVDDYGISYVRLFQTFLVSGLAAVAGVYVAVALPVAINTPVLRPASGIATIATSPDGAAAPAPPPSQAGTPATAAAPTAAAAGAPQAAPTAQAAPRAATTPGVTPAPAAAGAVGGTPAAAGAPSGIAGSGTPSDAAMPRLVDVYDIERYPFGVLLAAVFGLTPGLLISRLSQGVERYRNDLRSSEPRFAA